MPREPEDPEELGAAETVVDPSGPTLVANLVSVPPPGNTRVSDLRKGDVLGRRYELLAELGRGAHGAVFRAFDRHAQEQVALKIMLEPTGEELALLRRELSMARKVTHPGVARLHDLDGVSDKLWLKRPGSPDAVIHTEGIPTAVASTADGSRLVVSTDRGIVVIDLNGDRKPRSVTDQPTDASASFDSAGAVVFTRIDSAGKATVLRVPAEGGEPVPLGVVSEDVMASPTAPIVVYLDVTPDGSTPMLFDGKASRPLSGVITRGAYYAPAFSSDGRTVYLLRGPREIVSVDVATGRVLRAAETAAEHLLRVIPTGGDDLYVIEQRWRGSIFLAALGTGDEPAPLASTRAPPPPTAPRAP